MAGTYTKAELLTLFPVTKGYSVMHGRSRTKTRKTHSLHGRARGSHLTAMAKKDPFKHKGQAKGQG